MVFLQLLSLLSKSVLLVSPLDISSILPLLITLNYPSGSTPWSFSSWTVLVAAWSPCLSSFSFSSHSPTYSQSDAVQASVRSHHPTRHRLSMIVRQQQSWWTLMAHDLWCPWTRFQNTVPSSPAYKSHCFPQIVQCSIPGLGTHLHSGGVHI